MRHKYDTPALVLSRNPLGEASVLLTLLSPELGLVRARVQSVRKPGAKLAPSLQTLSESDVILIRGKDGWRLSGAVLARNWFGELSTDARARAGRTVGLLLRLVHGESMDMSEQYYTLLLHFLEALLVATERESEIAEELTDAAECLAALRMLQLSGVDAGAIPGEVTDFSEPVLIEIAAHRNDTILRINRGIAASGL